MSMWFTCGEETEGRLLHITIGGRGIRRWKLDSSPPRVNTPACSNFYCLILAWTLEEGSSLTKIPYSLNECWPEDSTEALRHSHFWQRELAATATSSMWLAERAILNSKTGWCNNTLNTKSWKVSKSTSIQLIQLLFWSQRYNFPAVSTWLVARGTRLRFLREYCKYR